MVGLRFRCVVKGDQVSVRTEVSSCIKHEKIDAGWTMNTASYIVENGDLENGVPRLI